MDSVGPEADVAYSILQRRSAFCYICRSCMCIASCIASAWLNSQHLQRGTRPPRQSPEHTKVLICSQRVPSIARGTFPHHSMLKQGRGFSSAFFLTVLLGLRSPILSRRKSSPIIGLDRPRGFQEVKAPRFRDNSTGWWQVVSLTHRPPLTPGNTPGTHFC